MPALPAALFLVAGLVLLVLGGELLVRGASALAAAARISSLVIGLTVVAFGTSAPELAVSVQASYAGQADVAVGNVVGSNIMNILFILGLSALVAPITISSQLIRWDVPLMIAASFGMLALGLDGRYGRFDGVVLTGSLVVYIVWSIRQARRESRAVREELEREADAAERPARDSTALQVVFIVAGLVLLALGARWLVGGAVSIARLLGVSELLIGLTIVAIGTSLPEAVTSLVASVRGERDIAAGNVVGSNLFNILGVLGVAAMVSAAPIPVHAGALRFDIPVMIAVSVACLPIFFTGNRIARWEGGLFLAYYLAYVAYLILTASHSQLTRTFAVIMLGYVLPLTAVTLLVCAARALRSRRTGT